MCTPCGKVNWSNSFGVNARDSALRISILKGSQFIDSLINHSKSDVN